MSALDLAVRELIDHSITISLGGIIVSGLITPNRHNASSSEHECGHHRRPRPEDRPRAWSGGSQLRRSDGRNSGSITFDQSTGPFCLPTICRPSTIRSIAARSNLPSDQ